MYKMRELLYQGRSVHRHLDLRYEQYRLDLFILVASL